MGKGGWEPMRIGGGMCTGGERGRNWAKCLAKLHNFLQ